MNVLNLIKKKSKGTQSVADGEVSDHKGSREGPNLVGAVGEQSGDGPKEAFSLDSSFGRVNVGTLNG